MPPRTKPAKHQVQVSTPTSCPNLSLHVQSAGLTLKEALVALRLMCTLVATTWTIINEAATDDQPEKASICRGTTDKHGTTFDRTVSVTPNADRFEVVLRAGQGRAVPFDKQAKTVLRVNISAHLHHDAIRWGDLSPGLGGTPAPVPQAVISCTPDALPHVLCAVIQVADAATLCTGSIKTNNRDEVERYPGYSTSNGKGGKTIIRLTICPAHVLFAQCFIAPDTDTSGQK